MTKEELEDEISAIDAIYPDIVSEVVPQVVDFKIPEHEEVILQISFPLEYPDLSPEIIQVTTLNTVKYSDLSYLESNFNKKLEEIYRQGEVCMFELLTELQMFLESYNDRDIADKLSQLKIEKQETPEPVKPKQLITKADNIDYLAGWTQSDPIVDRGSTFIGFARNVKSVEEANYYLDLLVSDRKIAKSSHNMTAWRIKGENGVQYQDCDDDGEAAAGGRLLHLLTVRIMFLNTKIIY